MKKFFLFLTALLLILPFGFSQNRLTITENFDKQNSCTFTRVPQDAWAFDTLVSTSGKSLWGFVPTGEGDSIELISPMYDFTHYQYIIMRFSHICKVSDSDMVRIMYKENYPGAQWTPIASTSYKGASDTYRKRSTFSQNSYAVWEKNNLLAEPEKHWWQTESFDVSADVALAQVQFKFVIKKGSQLGSNFAWGWLIDNFELVIATSEIRPPFVEIISPFTKGTVYGMIPRTIYAKAAPRTLVNLKTPQLFVSYISPKGVRSYDTIPMTPYNSDSIFKAEIPTQIVGTQVTYTVYATDTVGNNATASSAYEIGRPWEVHPNCVAITSIDTPLVGALAGKQTPIGVSLQNRGTNDLTSAIIEWSVNGVAQKNFKWTGSLKEGLSAKVTIGTYVPTANHMDTLWVKVTAPNADTANPTTDNQLMKKVYGCSSIPSGTFTVSPTGNYKNIGDVLDFIRSCGTTGNVDIVLEDGIYTEAVDFSNFMDFMAPGTNLTLTSKSANAQKVILQSDTIIHPVITMPRAGNISISKLTLSGKGSGIVMGDTNYNISITDCRILLDTLSTVTNYSGIVMQSSTATNVRIENNYIEGAYCGLITTGVSALRPIKNLTFNANVVRSPYYGNKMSNTLFDQLNNNTITARVEKATAFYGLYMNGGSANQVMNNRIHATRCAVPASYGLFVSNFNQDSARAGVIANNEILINSTAVSYGLYAAASKANFYHNTVVMYGTGASRAMQCNNNAAGMSMNFYNNIFACYNSGYPAYIMYNNNIGTIIKLDYNNYYGNTNVGFLGSARTTMADWLIYSKEQNSTNIKPNFFDYTQSGKCAVYNGLYCPQPTFVPKDIQDSVRGKQTVMGCYTAKSLALDVALMNFVNWPSYLTYNQQTSVSVRMLNAGSDSLTSVEIHWSLNGVEQQMYTWKGSLQPFQDVTLNIGSYIPVSGNNSIVTWIGKVNTSNADNSQEDDTLRNSVYACGKSLAGAYNVGGEKADFVDLTEALFVLNTCGLGGNVTLKLAPGHYAAMKFDGNTVKGLSATTWLTFTTQNDTDKVYIDGVVGSSYSTHYGIQLENSAAYLHFDNLILNCAKSYSGVCIVGKPATPVHDIKISRCLIQLDPTRTSTQYGIFCTNANANGRKNIEIYSNHIDGGTNAIYFMSQGSAANTGHRIDSNLFTNQYSYVMDVQNLSLTSVSYNTAICRKTFASNNYFGIMVQGVGCQYICHNYVDGDYSGITGQFRGIYVSLNTQQANDTCMVCNNFVKGFSSNNLMSMYFCNARYNIYHNTVYVRCSNAAQNANRYALQVYSNKNTNTINVKNNNLCAFGSAYAFYIAKNQAWVNIDHNNYYGKADAGRTANLAYIAKALKDVAAVKAFDTNAINALPEYLNISNGGQFIARKQFECLPLVKEDYTGALRSTPTSVGAYNGLNIIDNAALVGLTSPAANSGVTASVEKVTVLVENKGDSAIRSLALQWSINGVTQAPIQWKGNIAPKAQEKIDLGNMKWVAGTNRVLVIASQPNAHTDQLPDDDTLNVELYGCTYAPLKGKYTIGSYGAHFATLDDAVNALQYCGIAGPVVMELASGTYSSIDQTGVFPGSSAQNNITFVSKSGKAADVVIGSSDPTAICLNNVNYVTFKNLSIGNPVTTQKGVELKGANVGIHFEHCNIYADTNAISGAYAVFQNGGSCDSVFFVGNTIAGGVSNIQLSPGSGPNYGMVIDSNNLVNAYTYGVSNTGGHLRLLTHNYIRCRKHTTANYTAINWGSSSRFDTVASNRIYIDNISAQAIGMNVSVCVRYGSCLVMNNEFLINTTSTASCYGMYSSTRTGAGAVGSWINMIHNTFYVAGKGTSYALYYIYATAGSANTYVPSKPAQVKYNNLYVDANTNSALIYYDQSKFAVSPYVLTDYNNYYNNNGQLLGNFGGVQAVSLGDMVTNTGQDGFSVAEDPLFKDLPNSVHTTGKHLMVTVDSTLVRYDLAGVSRPVMDYTNIGCYHDYMSNQYDVKMKEIVSPTQFGAVGKSLPVEVKIVNIGTLSLDSVEFHWTVNGNKMPVYVHHTALAHGEESKAITIGNFMPFSGLNTIVVWTEKPNGKTDGNLENDTASVQIMGCDSALAGTYRVGKSAAAKYKSVDLAVKALSYCGISGPVVFELETGMYDAQLIEGEIAGASAKNTITFVSVGKDKSLVVIGGDDELGLTLKNTGHLIFKHITVGSTDPKCASAVKFEGMAKDIEFTHCALNASVGVAKYPAVQYENSKSTSSYMEGVRFIANEIRGGNVGILLSSSAGTLENCTYTAKTPSWVQIDSNLFVENASVGFTAHLFNHITSFSHNTILSKEGSSSFIGVDFEEFNRVDSLIGNHIKVNSGGYGINFMAYVNDINFGSNPVPVRVANNEILCKSTSKSAMGVSLMLANVDLIHNSIYVSSTGANNGVYIEKYEKGYSVALRNNIIACENGQENNLLFLASSELLSNSVLTSDYNVYYAGTTTNPIVCEQPITFSAWQLQNMDKNSKVSQPYFINTDNSLEIRQFNADFRCLRDKVITTDIKGNKRTALTVAGAYSTPLFEGYDLSVNSFVEPVQEEIPCVPNSTPVKVCIYNQGIYSIDFSKNPMKLYLKCASDSVNIQTSITINKDSLGVMCCDTFELISNLDITYLGMYKLTAWLECNKDQQSSNDTLVLDYQVNKTILPYDNNFSGSFTGVKMNQICGDIAWEVSDSTSILNPQYGTHRALFRSSEARGSISQILFSSVRLQGSFRPQLYFWYAHDNANPNLRDQMDIRISQDGGSTFKTIDHVYRYDAKCTKPTWKMHHIDLSNYTTGSCIVLSFMAYSYGGGDQALDLVRLVAMQDMALTVDVPSDTDFYACNLNGKVLTAYLENQTSQEVPFNAGDSITIEMSGAANSVYKKALIGRLEDFEIDTLQLGPIDYVGGGQLDVKVYVNSIDSNRANDTVKYSLNLNPDLAIISSDPIGLTNPGDTLHAGITLKNMGNLDIVTPFDVRLVVNGEDTITERITSALKVGATLHYTFVKPYTVPETTSDQPYFLLDIAALLSCDANADNDSVQVIGNVDVIDYGVLSIIKPVNGKCHAGGEEVAIEVRLFNNGTVNGTDSLVLTAVIDSAGVVYKTIVEKIAPMYAGENRNHVFTQKYSVPRLSVNNAQETYTVMVYLQAVKGDIYSNNDTAIVESCVEGGVGVAEAASESWNMGQNVPNPAGNVTLVPFTLPEAGVVTFTLMGMNGQVLYREEISAEAGQNDLQVNTSDYATGIYYYSMEYKGQRLVKKMNVVR